MAAIPPAWDGILLCVIVTWDSNEPFTSLLLTAAVNFFSLYKEWWNRCIFFALFFIFAKKHKATMNSQFSKNTIRNQQNLQLIGILCSYVFCRPSNLHTQLDAFIIIFFSSINTHKERHTRSHVNVRKEKHAETQLHHLFLSFLYLCALNQILQQNGNRQNVNLGKPMTPPGESANEKREKNTRMPNFQSMRILGNYMHHAPPPTCLSYISMGHEQRRLIIEKKHTQCSV